MDTRSYVGIRIRASSRRIPIGPHFFNRITVEISGSEGNADPGLDERESRSRRVHCSRLLGDFIAKL